MDRLVRLFFIDDHKMFLEGISSLLAEKARFVIVGSAKHGKEALNKIKGLEIDIILSDISMPEMDGLTFTREVKKVYPAIKVMIVSSFYSAMMIENAIKADVDGYLLKNTGRAELLLALDHIQEGKKYFSEEVRKAHEESLFSSRKKKQSEVELSAREKDVLKYIFEEKSTQEISALLHLSINTIETHRKNLMRKVGAKNMVGLVKYAIQQGLV